MKTRQIKSSEFQAGMLIRFYGATFRLRDDVKRHDKGAELPVFTATGDWVEGDEVDGYFGQSRPWKFQGNDLAVWAAVEA